MEYTDCEGIYTSELWYDLMDGGYIDPKLMLKNDEDIERVCAAIETLHEFVNGAVGLGIIEVE